MTSEEAPSEWFVRFVETFTADDRPELLAISGGEAFLRPALVQRLADHAASVGCRTIALSGMFWAKGRGIPAAIRRAIEPLAHFSASLDVFHEREVRREHLYDALKELLAAGKPVSVHLTGLGPDDPYLAERTQEIERIFHGRVPMVVNTVNAVGRARAWAEKRPEVAPAAVEAEPCTLAMWPLIAFDGTIVACGNDDVVDGPAPAHLKLGHASVDSWATIRSRALSSPMLRAIRTFGPRYVADRHGGGAVACNGYCSTCQRLSPQPELEPAVAEAMARPSAAVLEQQALALQREAGGAALARRFALPRYAELVTLGAPA